MEHELSYDLHIHSCLSPCGDDDMTPGNIVGMAAIKGLDVIAVTDHNSCRNCLAVLKLAEQYGVLAIPGMELTTAEEVHAVCLFSELSAAMEFDRFVYEKLMKFPNREEIFGKQQIMNEEDICIGTEPNLLINSTELSFDELWDIVTGQYGGVMIPAHIDKNANSLISNLGFVPPESQFRTAELHDMAALAELKKSNPYLEQCRSELDAMETADDTLILLNGKLKKAEAVVRAAGAELTQKRKAAAQALEQRIQSELRDLDMNKVRFAIEFTEKEPAADGCDVIRFLMSANAGEDLRPIAKIASGG